MSDDAHILKPSSEAELVTVYDRGRLPRFKVRYKDEYEGELVPSSSLAWQSFDHWRSSL